MKRSLHKIILVMLVISVFILSCLYMKENLCISILGDEFGYWSAAAFFIDKPWHSLTATNSYYGWGYGLILAPVLFLFNKMPVVMYHAAILINALFICLTLVISYKCTLCLSNSKNKVLAAFIAGVVTLYPSNFFSVYNTMPEIFLQFLYWLMVWCVLLITGKESIEQIDKEQFRLFLGLIVLAVYTVCVHQRTSGMVIDAIICFLFFYGMKKEKKTVYFIKFFCVIIFILAISSGIKSLYMNWIYLDISHINSEDTLLDNDFASVAGNFTISFLMLKGIVISAIGKVYYSFTSSALFAGAGLLLCILSIMRKKNNRTLFYLFILLGWLQAVGIAAIWMPGGFEIRTDILIYGRYIEYVLGPLMMVGLLGVCEKWISHIEAIVLIIIQSIITLITSIYIAPDSINTNLGNIFTLAQVFHNYSNKDAVFICNLMAILFFILFYLARNRKYLNRIDFILIYSFEIFIAVKTYSSNILPWTTIVSDNVNIVNIYQEERNMQDNLYIFDGGIGGKMIQFLNPNEECILVDEINDIEKDNLVITQYSKEILENISAQYEVLYKNNNVILWRK